MTEEVKSLPWHVNVDAEGYRETSEAMEANWDSVVEHEAEHGALFYAALGNRAADVMGYPERFRVEVPDEAQEAANEFVQAVLYDETEGSGQALYGLVADASDFRAEYVEAFGEENYEPLGEHVDAISESWQNYKNEARS